MFRKYALLIVFIFSAQLFAQVLGACGENDGSEAGKIAVEQKHDGGDLAVQPVPLRNYLKGIGEHRQDDLFVQPVPLPGQPAIDFKLPAVVGDEIKNIKLSDYNGKWRVLCFFPAAFTFV